MPVLQGWEPEDYRVHWWMYKTALDSRFSTKYERDLPGPFYPCYLQEDAWLGIGSTCKRNTNPEVVSMILDEITRFPCVETNFTKVHLFGFKKTGLAQANIKDRIHSADSFAYDFADRMEGKPRTTKMRIKSARRFGKSIIHNNVQTNLL